MSVSVFISYAIESAEHNRKVMSFANKLKLEGIDVFIFNDMKLGERFNHFMEKIDECDFTLFVCTPVYKQKADSRECGVGYEWNIITTGVFNRFDERKFIPILFLGTWEESLPRWARGKYGVDYRHSSDTEFMKLVDTFRKAEDDKDTETLDFNTVKMDNTNELDSIKNKQRLLIVNEYGIEEVVDIVAHFTLKSNGKDYLIYTKNDEDINGNVMTFTSEIKINGDTVDLCGVSEDIWPEIKKVMISIANDND